MNEIQLQIVDFVKKSGEISSKEIFEKTGFSISFATMKRLLSKLVSENFLVTTGTGKSTKYIISPVYKVVEPISMEVYYQQEIDERKIQENFNFSVISDVFANHSIFNERELKHLDELQKIYKKNSSLLSESEYKKELERLAIDLTWKSSQIEGNTYSLLETEILLKERETAAGKSKEEADMLLNHKEAIDFIVAHPDYLQPLNVSKIENIHSLLIKELGVERNLRKRRVGISGTNYNPLDNEFQILEALNLSCEVINNKKIAFEKALLALLLISYIQPFMDGNKRTARIVSNALLINEKHCPISFRTVDSIEYKKAILLFYEQNNISNFKEIFIQQFEFAVKTYF